ncbi:MAG: tRNA (N6-threonylcarbamoyladenosine(37)-N6)-methyltransferase TrmO [Nitrososphaerota archaeon]
MAVKTIGHVETDIPYENVRRSRWKSLSKVVVDKTYVNGLKGLEDYSHIIVIYWMDRVSRRRKSLLLVRPRGKKDLPRVGIFATRNPSRPNPIAITVVELVKILGNTLLVRGLDALNGSPVLDIKPYDYYDIFPRIRVPHWFKKVWAEKGVRRN